LTPRHAGLCRQRKCDIADRGDPPGPRPLPTPGLPLSLGGDPLIPLIPRAYLVNERDSLADGALRAQDSDRSADGTALGR
jgi:hypothetical protein